MDDLKEIVFYQAHKRLSKDLLDFLLQNLKAKSFEEMASNWTAFEPVLKKMTESSGSGVRHLEAYFLELQPNWREYTQILSIMVEKFREASSTFGAFEFQLNYVENCWKSNSHPLS